jgi:hypothetical protein
VNEQFRTQFINRFAALLNTLFQPDTIVPVTLDFAARYEPLMQRQIWRFGYPGSVAEWNEKVTYNLVNFAYDRPCYMENHILDFFDLDDFPFHCSEGVDSIDELRDIVIYPNPSDGRFQMAVDFGDPLEVKVLDVAGRSFYDRAFPARKAPGVLQFDLGGIAGGLYFIRVRSGKYAHTFKLIIRK